MISLMMKPFANFVGKVFHAMALRDKTAALMS
jgi:hypothetical protein